MPRNQDQGVCYYRQMPETRTQWLVSGLRCMKSRQICKEIMASVPQNRRLKIEVIMPITWLIMPKIKANVPTKQHQGVCYHRQMSEKSTVFMESLPRSLKSKPVCTKVRASVPKTPGLKLKANLSMIWVSMPVVQPNVGTNQDQCVCYHRRMPETRIVCLES